jgi:hypothetical protein
MHPDFTQISEHVAENYGPAHVEAGYPAMVRAFGSPNSHDDDSKTDVAWDVRSPAGAVHIYNYKNGPAYTREGTIHDIFGFSIQGESEAAVRAAVQAAQS